MNTREIARGGLLAGFAVVLLYIGALIPQAAPALCISAGVVSAVPLIRSFALRTSLTVYAAAGALSLMLVPRKSVAAAYIAVCGLYPIVKYLIETRARSGARMALKLAYANFVLAVLGALVSKGVFPQLEMPGFFALAAFWFAANIGFAVFDAVLTRFIRFVRRYLPKI